MTVTPIPDVTVYRKLWAAWEPLSKEEQERVNKVENGLEGLAVNEYVFSQTILAECVYKLRVHG
jgi:hypothetical protein